MQNRKEHHNAALALIVLAALALACGALKGIGDQTDEANKLVQTTNKDLEAIDRIINENKDKELQLTRALNADDIEGAKRILDDSIKAIDSGLEYGQSAADSSERASMMKIDEKFKDYLSLKSQAIRKRVDAFKSLRDAAVILRNNLGSTDAEASRKAREDYLAALNNYKTLVADAKTLDREADDIARRNPGKIRPY
jgi:DNA replicative helicase MCM subunit Mcm2 (Cdc46/Mcm family)